jgi:hypothetical protein
MARWGRGPATFQSVRPAGPQPSEAQELGIRLFHVSLFVCDAEQGVGMSALDHILARPPRSERRGVGSRPGERRLHEDLESGATDQDELELPT